MDDKIIRARADKHAADCFEGVKDSLVSAKKLRAHASDDFFLGALWMQEQSKK